MKVPLRAGRKMMKPNPLNWNSLLRRFFDCSTLYLPRSVVANVHIEILAERALASGAMAHPASDQMCRRPHHLRVMADLEDLIRRIRPVLEVLVLHVPHSDGEVPATFRTNDSQGAISICGRGELSACNRWSGPRPVMFVKSFGPHSEIYAIIHCLCYVI